MKLKCMLLSGLLSLMTFIGFFFHINAAPIHEAVKNNDLAALVQEIHSGANVNEVNEGWTALMLAAYFMHTDCMKALLEVPGINVNRVENTDLPILFAISREYTEGVKLLIQYGANIEERELSGLTPLMVAAMRGSREIVEMLIASGANIDAKDIQGRTALMWVALQKHTVRSQLLRDSRGKQIEIVELLISQGADVDTQDNQGLSLFMLADSEIQQVIINKKRGLRMKSARNG